MNVEAARCANDALWSIEAAFAAIVRGAPVAATETVPLHAAAGRVAAVDVGTPIPLPRFDQSAMDGYGIHRDDVGAGARGPFVIAGAVHAGGEGGQTLRPGTVLRVLTGAAVPAAVGAVVMEEHVRRDDGTISLAGALAPGQNIRRRGEDVPNGATIVPAGVRLDARHIALLAASGCATVAVARRVRVGILSTGDELADPQTPLGPSSIYDSNRPMLMALLSGAASMVEDLGRVRDDLGAIAERLADVHRDFDLVVTSGGVCGSDADHTLRAIAVAGGRGTRIGLAMKPGKPLGFGELGACRIVCLPGNPVSTMVGALFFARPLLETLAGCASRMPVGLAARAAADLFHRPGRTEFAPAAIRGISDGGHLLIEKLGKGGSARLAPLVAADGLVAIPAEMGDVPRGARVTFHPFNLDLRI